MPAGTPVAYNSFRERVGDGTIDLDGHTFKVCLLDSGYTPDVEAHTNYAHVSGDELATANGYTAGGATVVATWTRSTVACTFDLANPAWLANGGSIAARYAAVYDDSDASKSLVAYVLLDTTPADVTVTNGYTLTLQINVAGLFALTGMTA